MANRALDWMAQAGHDLQHARHTLKDGDYFTTFVSSRFVDREAIVEALRALAQRLKLRLFGISQGQGVGIPNLLGARRKEPEQVRDSDTSHLQTPRDPKLQYAKIVAVHLFGSFATRMATPRSDADILVEITDADPALGERLREAALAVFLEAPVSVDVFVLASERVRQGRGVAGAVAREGVRLA